MQLFNASNIDTLPWPTSEQALFAKRFLLPLFKEGATPFVKNVATTLYALLVGDYVLPITVNEKEYDNAYVASCYCSVPYLQENIKRKFPKSYPLFSPLLAPLKLFLKGVKINKMVVVNNWLFSTNLSPPLTQEHIDQLTSFLTKRFPGHFLMFRSVHTLDQKALYTTLKKGGYRLISSRKIFVFDPKKQDTLRKSAKRKMRQDVALLESDTFAVVDGKTLKKEELPRILELYNAVYLKKYSALSPKYSLKFLQHAIDNDLLSLKVLKKREKPVGVMGYYTSGPILTDPFFGYDTSLPHKEGVYRVTSTLSLLEAIKHKKVAHMGSGGDVYKKKRGCTSHVEYIAIYDKHLPISRQLMWFFSEKLMNSLLKD